MSDFTVPSDITTAAGAEVLRRMAEVAAVDPSLAHHVDVVSRPLVVLQNILREAGDVLRGDPLAVERLRLQLVLAAPFVRVIREPDAIDPREGEGDGSIEREILALAPREAALCGISVRALFMTAVAVVRAAPGRPVAGVYLRCLRGLALAAAPVEALARLDPFDPRDELIRQVLRLGVTADDRIDVAAFASDLDEVARWRTLRRLLAGEFIQGLQDRWDATQWNGARTIRVDRILTDRGGDQGLVLLGEFPTGSERDEGLEFDPTILGEEPAEPAETESPDEPADPQNPDEPADPQNPDESDTPPDTAGDEPFETGPSETTDPQAPGPEGEDGAPVPVKTEGNGLVKPVREGQPRADRLNSDGQLNSDPVEPQPRELNSDGNPVEPRPRELNSDGNPVELQPRELNSDGNPRDEQPLADDKRDAPASDPSSGGSNERG